MPDLIVTETLIRRDFDGRYCLNDLHRASGGAGKDRPSRFLARKETRELAAEVEASTDGIRAVATSEGNGGGTYVARELVYAYAMWISPAFALKVIRTYDAMVQAQIDKLNELSQRRARAELEYLEAHEEASRCGIGLRKWRDVGPSLEARIKALKEEGQLRLFLN